MECKRGKGSNPSSQLEGPTGPEGHRNRVVWRCAEKNPECISSKKKGKKKMGYKRKETYSPRKVECNGYHANWDKKGVGGMGSSLFCAFG